MDDFISQIQCDEQIPWEYNDKLEFEQWLDNFFKLEEEQGCEPPENYIGE